MNLLLKVWIAVFISFGADHCVEGVCPPKELLTPCVCKDNEIYCGGNTDIDLVQIFDRLDKSLNKTEKHFKKFYLNNTAIYELKDYTFGRITFDNISIIDSINLTEINSHTFFETELVTKAIYIHNTPLSEDNSIYEVISKFMNLESLYLGNTNLTEIPSNTFQKIVGYQDKLKTVQFSGTSFNQIGNNAFSVLNNLQELRITETSIDNIPEHAFEFEESSNEVLTLSLVDNSRISSTGFTNNSLALFKRPVILELQPSPGQIFDYLDQIVFQKFLEINNKNQITAQYLKIECKYCNNYWLTKNKTLTQRITNTHCSNNKSINDPDTFKQCQTGLMKPCFLNKTEPAIYCFGDKDFDLKGMLSNFSDTLNDSEKHFKKFYLNNTSIKILEENTFKDLTFDEIIIDSCKGLTTIDRNAFNVTDLVTKILKIYSCPKLSSPDNSIFVIMSKFVLIKAIYFKSNGIKEIPSNAFGYQKNLRTLYLESNITKIGSNAFHNLPNVTEIQFRHADFKTIQDNAFAFKYPSKTLLVISFMYTQHLNSSVFSENSFMDIKRPTSLYFGTSSMSILNEKVFLPLLLGNKNNTIYLWATSLDCIDCRNYWLKKNKLFNRIVSTQCIDGKIITDEDNFKNCSSTMDYAGQNDQHLLNY